MDDLGRVVVVAAGFALWKGGRCIAAARWADIQQLRAYRPANTASGSIRLVITLADGSVLEANEDAPGFDAFLDRGSATLSGLLPLASWHPALVLATPGSDGTVIFERATPKRRR